MRLAAAAAAGAFVYLLAALLSGRLPGSVRVRGSHSVRGDRSAWLTQAGLSIRRRQFWLASTGLGIAVFGGVWLITGVFVVALIPGVIASVIPRYYFARAGVRRLGEVQAAWPDGIRDLVASISAGSSLHRAVEDLSRSGPPPIRDAFARFSATARTMGVVTALESVKEQLSDPTSDRVLEVLILAHERGGSIVPSILQDLATATTKDLWALEDLRTQQLEQKINARAVFVLPWLVLVALTARPGVFRDFYAGLEGALIVGLGALLSTGGMLIVSRLGRDPDELRVFGGAAGERSP